MLSRCYVVALCNAVAVLGNAGRRYEPLHTGGTFGKAHKGVAEALQRCRKGITKCNRVLQGRYRVLQGTHHSTLGSHLGRPISVLLCEIMMPIPTAIIMPVGGVISNGYGVVSNGYGVTSNGYGVISNGYGVISNGYGVISNGFGVTHLAVLVLKMDARSLGSMPMCV